MMKSFMLVGIGVVVGVAYTSSKLTRAVAINDELIKNNESLVMLAEALNDAVFQMVNGENPNTVLAKLEQQVTFVEIVGKE